MYDDQKVTCVIAAAGKGTRFGSDIPKQFLKLKGRTILEHTADKFQKSDLIDEIVVVTSEAFLEYVSDLMKPYDKVSSVISGGKERQDSVYNGVRAGSGDIILIHDAARPFITEEVTEKVIMAAAKDGCAVPVVNPKDSIRTEKGNLNRNELFMIQTPQGFRRDIILDAYDKAMKNGFYGTDDGGIAEYAGYRVVMTEGDYENIKITTREDMPDMETRIGSGFDVHKLVEGRKCILMGVEIPYELGLLGHSDADVALHALMDAMLGAAGMGDIGRLFPDTDPDYEGADSMKLMENVRDRIYSEGWSVGNVDVTIICQKPKVSPYIGEMTRRLSEVLGIETDRINIKGTTTEKLGFTGRGEGIASQAVCTLIR